MCMNPSHMQCQLCAMILWHGQVMNSLAVNKSMCCRDFCQHQRPTLLSLFHLKMPENSHIEYESVATSLCEESLDDKMANSEGYRAAWPWMHWRWRVVLSRTLLAAVSAGVLLAMIALGHWLFITFVHQNDVATEEKYTALIEHAVDSMASGKRLSCNCGESVAEARANGCKYDSISAAWLPPYCRDDALAEEFNHAGPGPNGEWEYYTDINKTRRLSLEEISLLADNGGFFYMTQQWHVRHCHFVWRMQFRARWTKIHVSLRDDNEHHIMHCMMMAEKRDPLGPGDDCGRRCSACGCAVDLIVLIYGIYILKEYSSENEDSSIYICLHSGNDTDKSCRPLLFSGT